MISWLSNLPRFPGPLAVVDELVVETDVVVGWS